MTLTNEKKKTLKRDFWYGKRVFITGNTGFKGSWLTIWLKHMGANIIGFSNRDKTKPSLYEVANLSKIVKQYYLVLKLMQELKGLHKL